MTDSQVVLEGWVSILSALRGSSRRVHRILLREGRHSRPFGWIEEAARAAEVEVVRASEAEIDHIASGGTHGGAVALAGERRYLPPADLGTTRGLVVMLDGVEDPYNFGQAIRAVYAAGAEGLVIRPRTWASAAGVVARASAGASELIATALAPDAGSAIEHFRSRGYRTVTTGRRGSVPLYEADLATPLFLLLGGERRGVTRSVLEQADLVISIPYGRDFSHSLGVAVSAAIIAFEILRRQGSV